MLMEPIPFTPFFNALRKNGFSVTHTQIMQAYKLIVKYSGRLKDDEEMCLYLVPIFANSEDEQRLFKEIFHATFITAEPARIRKSFARQFETAGKKTPFRLIAVYGLIALLFVSLIVFTYNHSRSIDPDRVNLFVNYINGQTTYKNKLPVLNTRTGQALKLHVSALYQHKLLKELAVNARCNWGDGAAVNDSFTHVYTRSGDYTLNLFADIIYKEKFIRKDSFRCLVKVCPAGELWIDVSAHGEIIPVNRTIVLSAFVTGKEDDSELSFVWKEGGEVLGEQRNLHISYPAVSSHNITCIAYRDGQSSGCSLKSNVMLNIGTAAKTPAAAQSDTAAKAGEPGAEAAIYHQPDKTFLYWLYFILAVVFCSLSVLFFVLYQKAIVVKSGWKSPEANEHLRLIFSPSVKRLKKELHFNHHDYLIVDQHQLTEIVKPLRSRINGNVELLHVQKTIQKSINSFGLFQAVAAPITRPPEYLVLIDQHAGNPMMVKLFEYLVDQLLKQNIVVEKFYYQHDPAFCYSLNESSGISLDKLSARYNKHILLILGDAHQLVNDAYSVINRSYSELINQWQYKAVITPVSYSDWTIKEKVLSADLPLFPADIEGLSVFTSLLFSEKKNVAAMLRLKAAAGSFYTSTGIDFENADELAAYCDTAAWAHNTENGVQVNVMFEWIRALAVYPKIHWQVAIAIGKAILEKYGMPGELNFTNLLRMVRIDWIKQGAFPDDIRLHLLKSMPKDNEAIARKTVLRLLNGIPATEVPEDTTAYAERELQKVINEFNLYAHNPNLYPQYRQSKEVFQDMWTEGMLQDQPLQLYLTNKDSAWQNLLQHDSAAGNLPIEKYFETIEIEENNLSRLYLWLSILSVFVFVSSFFAILILYRWDAAGM